MTTTFEEAKNCPICGRPGDDRQTKRQRNSRGAMVEVHMIYCVTKLCRWYNTAWIVQINEDGSIPEAYSQLGEKSYPKLSQESATRVEENIARQLAAETKPGEGTAEIRNPKG